MKKTIAVAALASISLLTAIGASAQTKGSAGPYTIKIASETISTDGIAKSSTETTGIARDRVAKASMSRDVVSKDATTKKDAMTK